MNEAMKQKVGELAAELEEERNMNEDVVKFKDEVKDLKSKIPFFHKAYFPLKIFL